MTDIRIEGYSVDLRPDAALTLERFSPLLDFNSVQGSRVYGFTLPSTPTNRRVLGYFYQPQVGYDNRRYTCEKYVDGQLVEVGYVKLHQVTEAGFELYFTQNLGEIFGDLQNVPLSEIDFGTMAMPTPVAVVDPLTAACAWPVIENPSFYGNQAAPVGWSGHMNPYAGGQYASEPLVPQYFLRWVMQQYGALTGWNFRGEFWNDADLQRLLLFNLYELSGHGGVFRLQSHLPPLSMPSLLIDLRKLFNLYMEFDVRRRTCTLDFAENVLAGNLIVDWTAKAAPSHVKLPDLTSRLELSYDIDSSDALLKPIPPSMDKYVTPETVLNEGGSLMPIRARVSTLLTNPGGMATLQQPGITTANKENRNGGTPRLLLYNGMVGGLPLATSAHGNRSLLWHGPNNLVERGYRLFEGFKESTFLVKKSLVLTPADLARFSFRQKVHIKGVNYLVGSLKASLTGGRTIPCEAELWRV